tara:strand:- start:166 stop:267 length:102 start_codon:yes stop_codon:yes gene_type:complete
VVAAAVAAAAGVEVAVALPGHCREEAAAAEACM